MATNTAARRSSRDSELTADRASRLGDFRQPGIRVLPESEKALVFRFRPVAVLGAVQQPRDLEDVSRLIKRRELLVAAGRQQPAVGLNRAGHIATGSQRPRRHVAQWKRV